METEKLNRGRKRRITRGMQETEKIGIEEEREERKGYDGHGRLGVEGHVDVQSTAEIHPTQLV